MNCTDKFLKHSERVGARFAEHNAGVLHRSSNSWLPPDRVPDARDDEFSYAKMKCWLPRSRSSMYRIAPLLMQV